MIVFQKPNKPLIIMFAGYLLAAITNGFLQTLGSAIFVIAGTIWSYLEITDGANWFRRLLGALVLLLILWNLLMHLK